MSAIIIIPSMKEIPMVPTSPAQPSLNSTKENTLKSASYNYNKSSTLASINTKAKGSSFKSGTNQNPEKNRAAVIKKQPISRLRVGDFCELKVTALGPNGVGIDEFSFGYPVLIPKAKLGEKVKAQIKLFYPLKKPEANTVKDKAAVLQQLDQKNAYDFKRFVSFTYKKAKYAVAQISSVLKQAPPSPLREKATPPFPQQSWGTGEGSPLIRRDSDSAVGLRVGDVLTVKLNSIVIQTDNSSIGLVDYDLNRPSKFCIIIPLTPDGAPTLDQEIQIQVTRVKFKYCFAKRWVPAQLTSLPTQGPALSLNGRTAIKKGNLLNIPLYKRIRGLNENLRDRPLTKGSKITLTLPKITTQFAQHMVIRLALPGQRLSPNKPFSSKDRPYVLFIKNLLGAQFGDKVRVKFTKIGDMFAIGKIVRIAPNSALKKLARTRKNINEMLANGMHFGEKVVKCQARMRSYIWNRTKIQKNSYVPVNTLVPSPPSWRETSAQPPLQKKKKLPFYPHRDQPRYALLGSQEKGFMRSPAELGKGAPPATLLRSAAPDTAALNPSLLFERGTFANGASLAGGTSGFNRGDKNSPLIKKGRHLINLLKTRRCLNIGLNQLTKYAAKGRTFLFVGTKKPAAGLIARAALFSKTSFFVNTRWLGGMLTNWKTIILSIAKIRPILKEKQKVITNILQKRAKIKNRLIKKVLSLRKKSKVLIKKGKQLIEKVKVFASSGAASSSPEQPLFYGQGRHFKRIELFERGQFLLQKRQSLLQKQYALKVKTLSIKENGFLISNKYKVLLNKLTATRKKLHDLGLLFLLNKELRYITKLAKERGKTQYTLSYMKVAQRALKQLPALAPVKVPSPLPSPDGATTPFAKGSERTVRGGKVEKISSKNVWLIPNPPQTILNKILITINEISNLGSQKALFLEVRDIGEEISPPPNSLSPRRVLRKGNEFSKGGPDKGVQNEQFKQDLTKSIILTKLLSKFSRFLPYIKNGLRSLLRIMLSVEKKMTELKTHLKLLKKKLIDFMLFNNKINAELKLIQAKYASEQQIIRVLRRKLKRQEAEKKLLQFLPKLRYLPTPKSQIALAIQILMKRFVDPKLKYPMDLIYDEKLRKKSKKVAAARKKKWQRLETYFGGIANMTKLKKTQISNNVAIIIGQQEEINAVRECKKLGIKMFHIVDTNCNPGLADHFIPSNDDSRNSIKYLLTKLVTRIRLAQKIRLLKIFQKSQKARV